MLTEVFIPTETTVDADGNVEESRLTLAQVEAAPLEYGAVFNVATSTEMKIIDALFPERTEFAVPVDDARNVDDIVEAFRSKTNVPDEIVEAIRIALAVRVKRKVGELLVEGWAYSCFVLHCPASAADVDPFITARRERYEGKPHIIARWGEALEDWGFMLRKAAEKVRAKMRVRYTEAAALLKSRAEAMSALNPADQADAEIILDSTAPSSYSLGHVGKD